MLFAKKKSIAPTSGLSNLILFIPFTQGLPNCRRSKLGFKKSVSSGFEAMFYYTWTGSYAPRLIPGFAFFNLKIRPLIVLLPLELQECIASYLKVLTEQQFIFHEIMVYSLECQTWEPKVGYLNLIHRGSHNLWQKLGSVNLLLTVRWWY